MQESKRNVTAGAGRLGTRMRGALAEAYEARGHHSSSLWFLYSPKSDSDVVLRSDLEYGHFLLAESDPAVIEVNYAPEKRVTTIAGEGFATIVDAELVMRSGATIWREIKASSSLVDKADIRANFQILTQVGLASGLSVEHQVFTEQEIFANPQKTLNWHRAISHISAAREWALHDYSLRVVALMNARRLVTLRDISNLGKHEYSGLFVAAALRAVQKGLFESDLDSKPLTLNSAFWVPGEARQ